jgi:hypothetical protein
MSDYIWMEKESNMSEQVEQSSKMGSRIFSY